jgi:hypothetical protein
MVSQEWEMLIGVKQDQTKTIQLYLIQLVIPHFRITSQLSFCNNWILIAQLMILANLRTRPH